MTDKWTDRISTCRLDPCKGSSKNTENQWTIIPKIILRRGSSLQVENLFVCLSSLQYFECRPFISSQDHSRPHISFTAGQRMMSAVIWWCQWHTQRQIQIQIHRQRQIQSASKTQRMLYFLRAGGSRISNMTWKWTCRTWMDNGHGRGGHKDKDTHVRWGLSDGYILSFFRLSPMSQESNGIICRVSMKLRTPQSYIRKYLSSLWPRFFLF